MTTINTRVSSDDGASLGRAIAAKLALGLDNRLAADVSSDEATHFHTFVGNGMVDASAYSQAYVINSFLVDKMAGVTQTDRIWGGAPINSAYISRSLASGSGDAMRAAQKFFSSNAMRSVFPKLVGSMTTWRVGGYRSSVTEVFEHILEKVGNAEAAGALTEMLMPILSQNEVVIKPGDTQAITTRFTLPSVLHPTLEDVARELARTEIESSVNEATTSWSVEEKKTYSVAVCADELSAALFPISHALRRAYDYQILVLDIVRAVRSRLDPECIGFQGKVPRFIQDHSVVTELMGNWTFIQAALALDPATDNLTPTTTEFAFDKWAGAVLASIKGSMRYAFRSRREILANIDLRHVTDLEGYRRAAVVYEHAKLEAISLSVLATPDDRLTGAYTIEASTGRLDAFLAAAYGDSPNTFCAAALVPSLLDVLRYAVEERPDVENIGVFSFFVRPMEIGFLATLLADRVHYQPSKIDSTLYQCTLAPGARVKLTSGVTVGQTVYTTDPLEVLLVSMGPTSVTLAPPLPQLLPKSAIKSRLLAKDLGKVFMKVNSRYAFSKNLAGVPMQGAIRLAELETARADLDSVFVLPEYNRRVYMQARGVLEAMYRTVEVLQSADISHEAMIRSMKRVVALAFINAARGVAPAFRGLIHAEMRKRSLKNVDQGDIRLSESRLNQGAAMAFADVFAAFFFFASQGISNEIVADDQKAILTKAGRTVGDAHIDPLVIEIWNDVDVFEHLSEMGYAT